MSYDIVKELKAWGDQYCVLDYGKTMLIGAKEIERLRKQRNDLAWAIAWFLNGGSRDKLEQRFKDYEKTL